VTIFQDPDQAQRARERLEQTSGLDLGPFFDAAFPGCPAPDLALVNLERWLRATTSPAVHLEQLVAHPKLGRLLVSLLGASQPLADTLIQNPELASLVVDPVELARPLGREAIEEEGRTLLAVATSHPHALDRLRFLKQRWLLPTVVNDLSATWEQEAVWKALSDLADALITLSYEVAWNEAGRTRALEGDCPVGVVAFGKLGGSELNYSSDVDLVYVSSDESELPERDLTRYCESLGRTLSDRMGRGSLYRVDLRLRPYGAAGPIVRSMRGVEKYYELYAEPWEVQALLRSRVVVGPPGLAERWEALVRTQVFKPALSELALEQMLEMRTRIEAMGEDLKRGAGGIRDVEFLTQVLQLLHGNAKPELQVKPTLEALRALEEAGVLDHAVGHSLRTGYVFLRKLEHRCQLVGDVQTHDLPSSEEAQENLARTMGLANWKELCRRLEAHRRTIGILYRTIVGKTPVAPSDRATVAEWLGPLGPALLQWLDPLPESDAFFTGLVENEGSLRRFRQILDEAPRLVPFFKQSVPLTEMLMSGEIEEQDDPVARIDGLSVEAPLSQVASVYGSAWARTGGRWVLEPTFDLPEELTRLFDALVRHALRRLYAEFDVITLGSQARFDMSLDSDGDLLFLVESRDRWAEAEQQAQGLLSLFGQLKRLGSPASIDLRLRPEGGKGLLVRTYSAFRAYELESMEMWERFALGQSRLVFGSPEAQALVDRAAYALPLTPERLRELLQIKRRVENERVRPQHRRRDVKLGYGGLSDLEWFVHLHEMRYPTASRAGTAGRLDERIGNLARAHLVNAVEAEELIQARRHHVMLRLRLGLLGYMPDVLPENPDKLDRLARACRFDDGNALLARHEVVIERVRAIYLEGLERLKA
jgi:[glutamine synthetase] adenylyltransferase / [glutamine synthetase]-adenylyl-L-tyrosine phosphorylase